jgi:hypothetical protein
MTTQHHSAPGDLRGRDSYTRERSLNSAIIGADIGRGWEEYLALVQTVSESCSQA